MGLLMKFGSSDATANNPIKSHLFRFQSEITKYGMIWIVEKALCFSDGKSGQAYWRAEVAQNHLPVSLAKC
jgi:hypothetical protein